MKKYSKKIAVIIAGFVFAFIFLEASLRIGGFLHTSLIRWRNLASLRRKSDITILCLGESISANQYPPVLQRVLNERTDNLQFNVIDEAREATDSRYIVAHINDFLDMYNPDIVIVMMGLNDDGEIQYGELDAERKELFRIVRLFRLIIYNIRETLPAIRNAYGEISRAAEYEMEQVFERVEKFNKGADFQKAEKELLELKKKYPDEEEIYFELARIYDITHSHDKLQLTCKRVLQINRELSWAYEYLGKVSLTREEYSDAEKYFRETIKLGPQSSYAYHAFGGILIKEGRIQEARQFLEKEKERNPQLKIPYIMGRIYQELEEYDKARECFEKTKAERTIKWSPPSMTVHNYTRLREIVLERGKILFAMQYPTWSVEPLKKIVGDNPDIYYIDNEQIFREAVEREGYWNIFVDKHGGDFGHPTAKGKKLMAENIADVIFEHIVGK